MITPIQKTKAITIFTFILLLLVICIACFTTACQPTPQESIVTRRDNAEEVILEAAEQEGMLDSDDTEPGVTDAQDIASKPNVYEIIEHVDDRYSVGGGLEFVFDADVYTPVTDEYPVARIRPISFTNEIPTTIRECFFKGCCFVMGDSRTKNYFEQAIIDLKAEIANPDPNIGYMDGYFEDALERLKKQLSQAPETPEYEDASVLNIDGQEYNASAMKDDMLQGYIKVNENIIRMSIESGLKYSDMDYLLERVDVYTKDYIDATQFSMSEDEALEVCSDFLESFDIDYLVPSQITKEYFYEKYDRAYGGIVNGGYKIEYGQPLGAISPAKISVVQLDIDESMYGYIPPIEVEYLSIVIDGIGNIVSLRWEYPSQLTETIVEDVEILPFDEMIEKVKDFTQIKFGTQGDTPLIGQGYIVGNIGLYAYYLPMKDNLQDCMYTPCWVCEYKYSENIENGAESDTASEFMMFNAIDGAPVSVVTTRELESLNN